MKRIVLMFLVTLLVFTSTTFISGANPENTPKEEVIYGILDGSGGLKSISVVNSFALEKDATIVDYGLYESVQSLSSVEEIVKSGSSISFFAKSGRISYQGELSNRQLPWTIQIDYFLDGQPIEPEDLNGKTGKLKISVNTSKNTVEKGTFFEDFSLQVAVPLKMDLCKNIVTSGATIADNGSTKQFSYVLLPGENGAIVLTADVTDFVMDPITFAGIRMNFDLPLDVDKISQSINQLTSASVKLDSGAVALLEGATALKTGLQSYQEGFQLLNSQIGNLQTGASSLEMGIIDLSDGLSELSDQGASLRTGAQSIQQSAFDSANAQLAGVLNGVTLEPNNYMEILQPMASDSVIGALIVQLKAITDFTAGVESYTLSTTQLATGAAGLSAGAGSLSDGIDTLAVGLSQLYNGAASLNASMKAFSEGVATYREGTKAFSAGAHQMDTEMNNQLDALMAMLSNDGEIYHSYISEENTNVNFVQFVFKTDGINGETKAPATDPKPAEKSLWEKFLDLFK
jgi:X-X-X-Leu-X-X-Gly heptad repeat protein